MQRAAFQTRALALPGSTIGLKWDDDLVACVDGKMYAVLCLRGDAAGALSFKVPQEAFLVWTDRPGVRPAPYLARARWVQVASDAPLATHEVDAALRTSHALVAATLTRAARRTLGIEALPSPPIDDRERAASQGSARAVQRRTKR